MALGRSMQHRMVARSWPAFAVASAPSEGGISYVTALPAKGVFTFLDVPR